MENFRREILKINQIPATLENATNRDYFFTWLDIRQAAGIGGLSQSTISRTSPVNRMLSSRPHCRQMITPDSPASKTEQRALNSACSIIELTWPQVGHSHSLAKVRMVMP